MLYYSAKGDVDYTIVGSPTIVDNVLTDITANDYLSIGTYSGDTPTSIEIGASFKTSDATVLGRAVIGRLTGADTGIFWGNSSFPGRICFKHRVSYDNGTTWTAVESKSAALSLNTKYYVKFIISLAEQKLTGYVSTDNTNWTSYVANFNSGAILEGLTSIAIGKIFGHNASPLPIYLDYTYIKVNGKPWFGICPIEVKKHQLMGPVGYTITGTGPTVTDGILTGVGGSSTVYTSQTIPSFETFELVIKVKKKELSPNAPLPALALSSTAGDASYRVVAGGILSLRVGSSTPVISLDNFPYASLTGKWFYIRLNVEKNGNNYDYSIGYSTDKQNWTTGTGTSSSVFTQSIGFLKNSSGDGEKSSYMDFNETYIKINGKLWFWQPQETKRIVVNGVEVWTKPE